MTYLPSDKIRVFVSSRLGECEAERGKAREIIESLGHQPVMFEAAGARPYPPRSVYLRGVEESQVFVGVYREGYGYIAEGMEISGLDDEYRYSSLRGIPQLLYVLRAGEMEPRLRALVDGFTGPTVTVGYFEDTAEFAQAFRRDLVALVSDYFRRGRSFAESSPTAPGVVAAALVRPERRLRRKAVETELERRLEGDPVALVTGPLGSGKTVFLSDLCDRRNWALVECGEKAPQEVLTNAANAIRGLLNLPAQAYLLPADAQSALRLAWETSTSVTLVLDDLRSADTLDRVRSAAPVSNTHRLIVSSREDIPTAGSVYEVPPLDLDETREFAKMNRDTPLVAGELVEIHSASKGNPLYLRYYLAGTPGDFANNLTEYEARVWRSLTVSAQEVLCYLAWSDRRLSLEDLTHLVTGADGSAAEVAEKIGSASSLLVQSAGGYAIFHPHAKETIRNLTSRSTPQLEFYIQRLSKRFLEVRDYVSAFSALNSAGFSIPPKLLELAGRQAVIKGDLRTAIEILELQVGLARASSDGEHERDLTLYLAHVLSLAGRVAEALEKLDGATALIGNTAPPLDVSEMRLTISALGRGDRSAVEELLSKKEEYRSQDKLLDAGRLSVDLSVYYARQHEPRKSADEAQFAMAVFKECGDEYGYRIARGNYLSAISTLPELAAETADLIRELDAETEQEPRQRALLCNVLGRRARERGDTAGAKAYAREAIDIGTDVGDNSIICNNLMNLGNAYRDEENWESAIAEYEAADKVARDSNLVLAEAAGQQRMAGVFNRKGEGDRAIHHANYAISLARGVSPETESRSTRELAEAYELVNVVQDAREAWLRYAALEIRRTDNVESASEGFVRAGALLANEGDVAAYLAAYSRVFDIRSSKSTDLIPAEHLVEDLPDLFQKISLSCTFGAAIHHARLMFSGLSEALVRRSYFVAIRRLLSQVAVDGDAAKRLRILLALSMAMPGDTLRLGDLVDVGELISRRHDNISFRAHSDGAAHWTVELLMGKPVVVTVLQIDDEPAVSLVALCLVLVLVGFARDIFDDVLSGISPQGGAANVQVCNFSQARELLSLGKMGLVGEPDGCVVTRATDVGSDAGMPILVVTSSAITKQWSPGSGQVKYGQTLFAKVLVELVLHLQGGEIDVETLYPKVANLIRKTVV